MAAAERLLSVGFAAEAAQQVQTLVPSLNSALSAAASGLGGLVDVYA